jgi:hypothetical protein
MQEQLPKDRKVKEVLINSSFVIPANAGQKRVAR